MSRSAAGAPHGLIDAGAAGLRGGKVVQRTVPNLSPDGRWL